MAEEGLRLVRLEWKEEKVFALEFFETREMREKEGK